MGDEPTHGALSREEAHPRARAALPEFIWDTGDPSSPFGDETGIEVLDALYDFRAEDPRGNPIALLDELLARWEVPSDHWEVVDEAAVEALGREDELGLLLRDEAVLALAFAQIIVEGRVEPEVRRRAMLALTRQALPALLHGAREPARTRAARLEQMREALALRWD